MEHISNKKDIMRYLMWLVAFPVVLILGILSACIHTGLFLSIIINRVFSLPVETMGYVDGTLNIMSKE